MLRVITVYCSTIDLHRYSEKSADCVYQITNVRSRNSTGTEESINISWEILSSVVVKLVS